MPYSADAPLAVAINCDKAVIAWSQRQASSPADPNDLYAARLEGGTWSSPALLESRADSAGTPGAAIDADGNVSVVWQQSDDTSFSTYTTRFDESSSTWSGAELLEDSPIEVSIPQVAYDAAGNAFAVWCQGSEVVVSRFDEATATWSEAARFQPNSDTVAGFSLAVDAEGNALVAWVQGDVSGATAYAARFDALTNYWDNPQSIASYMPVLSVFAGVPDAGISAAISGRSAAVSFTAGEHAGARPDRQ